MPSVELSAGTIEYSDTGGDGPPFVLLHGLAMDGASGARWLRDSTAGRAV